MCELIVNKKNGENAAEDANQGQHISPAAILKFESPPSAGTERRFAKRSLDSAPTSRWS
jgi:hypothetical protein